MRSEIASVVIDAVELLRRGKPSDLSRLVNSIASARVDEWPDDFQPQVAKHLGLCGVNDPLLHAFTALLQAWDHSDASWFASTAPRTPERRASSYTLLCVNDELRSALNASVEIALESDRAVVIAEKHTPWYSKRRSTIKPFYWKHYAEQLRTGGWSGPSVAALEASVDDVIGRLADPTAEEIFASRGLVLGYVQSGKTSHFCGLVAKAVDAGYRLIIVLAGTLEILRQQTQRRIDKHIIGRELLSDLEYSGDDDWADFVSHSGLPSREGSCDWDRLTDFANDYQALGPLVAMLNPVVTRAGGRYNDENNLRTARAKLLVLKKNPARLGAVCDDLQELRRRRVELEHLPGLIIDDESDHASINTLKPELRTDDQERTATNAEIVRLLKLLPRAQYVGYTATPFANVFIDPSDSEDLFPRDFVISLPRPSGYMGASDFHDFDAEFSAGDFHSNRQAFVRPIVGEDSEALNLTRAVDAFVLAGAIKVFRESEPGSALKYKHHTMLVHLSAAVARHDDGKDLLEQIFRDGMRYQSGAGLTALRKLFNEDFIPVSKVRGDDLPFPESFDELVPCISKCLARINSDKAIRIVNGEPGNHDDTPDFDKTPVWGILIGGTKLSRGYTVEGLTVSYYRRIAGAGDTLMQMGRWFGFRGGYRDLVRLFIGTEERRNVRTVRTTNLYNLFEAACRDEEALRAEMRKYETDGIRPIEIPPLVRQHLVGLPPSSKNKMFNAVLVARDCAGVWIERTLAPRPEGAAQKRFREENDQNLAELLECLDPGQAREFSLVRDGARFGFSAHCGRATGDEVFRFLHAYRWSVDEPVIDLELDYLFHQLQAGKLSEWVVVLPQPTKNPTACTSVGRLNVFQTFGRQRDDVSGRYKVFTERRHRQVADAIAEGRIAYSDPSPAVAAQIGRDLPVLLTYLVHEEGVADGPTDVGFAFRFPGRAGIGGARTWTVALQSGDDAVVVSAP